MCIFRKFKWKFKCSKYKSKEHKLQSGHHRIIGTYLPLSLKKLGNICETIIFRYWTNQYRTVIPERRVTNQVSPLNSPFLLLWEFFWPQNREITELKNEVESKQLQFTEKCSTEESCMKVRKLYTKKDSRNLQRFFSWALISRCFWDWEKNCSISASITNSGAHIGPRLISLLISQHGKPLTTWDSRYSKQMLLVFFPILTNILFKQISICLYIKQEYLKAERRGRLVRHFRS